MDMLLLLTHRLKDQKPIKTPLSTHSGVYCLWICL